ncbi:MAG TPA: ATP-binding protein [Saprospiraceae bacterium]|nr:ATP-binding protein [Saprospiraceae bacterium]
MSFLKLKKSRRSLQYLFSIALIVTISITCLFFVRIMGYQVVALILLMAVSFLAMVFDILPVLTAAILSALIWNYFFIPPKFTFSISTPEDALMFLMYFVIAILNAVLTFKIRDSEKKARQEEEKENTIKLYNTLLNSLSHELRTPISTVIGAVDAMKENMGKLSEKDKSELLSEIEKAGTRLDRQVENLLNMSRLQSGIISLQSDWCDVNELIFSVIQMNKSDAVLHHIKFEPNEDLPLFKLDQVLIEQALYNILHNAIQYTPEGSVIFIDAAHEQETCVIRITDNGPGFPENLKNAVFEKFYRLPSSKTGGTGLGLSIVKGFVEAHHGTVHLENLQTGGAKFTIKIPAKTSFLHDMKVSNDRFSDNLKH